MKVVGFSQLRNEHSKGNLDNWFKIMDQLCEKIYIFDQASNDGSQVVYDSFKHKTTVIESPTNRFNEELLCKKELLDLLLEEDADADWILWLDGDTLIDGRLLIDGGSEFKELCRRGAEKGIEGFRFGHYNLWRSDIHYRVDSQYHDFHRRGRVPMWRNNGNLYFPEDPGLHRAQQVRGINRVERVDYSLIHRGFATDQQILDRYDLYKGLGQSGWSLERLLHESDLSVELLPEGVLPEWFELIDVKDPRNKRSIAEQRN